MFEVRFKKRKEMLLLLVLECLTAAALIHSKAPSVATAGCLASWSGGSGWVFSFSQRPPNLFASSWFTGQDCSFTREISRVAINTTAVSKVAVYHAGEFYTAQKRDQHFFLFLFIEGGEVSESTPICSSTGDPNTATRISSPPALTGPSH